MGNTLAISTLLRKRMRKKRTTTLFLHLAMADCLVTIFPMAGRCRSITDQTRNKIFFLGLVLLLIHS